MAREQEDAQSRLGPSVLLPTVAYEASAAVLIVDLTGRQVVFANDLACQLAPDVDLPSQVDEWSAAAGLQDVNGAELPVGEAEAGSSGRHAESLLRVAHGEPVTGEAVTAARETAATAAREILWVLGLPLAGAPQPLTSLALVTFLPARNAQLISGVQESALTLRDRAVLATRMSFTITDPTAPDNPLIWVNPAFTATTGYTLEESVGRNCRFLQGPDTDPKDVEQIRESLRAAQPVTTTLRNYRKDGTAFWNELSISPVRDPAGDVTHFVGVQADVTSRVEAQHARDDLMTQVGRAAERLSVLADFTSRLAMCRQPSQVVELLGEVLVPRIGTWVIVYTVDELGNLVPPYVRHERGDADPAVRDNVAALQAVVPHQLQQASPVWRVMRGEQTYVLIEDYQAAPPSVSGSAADDRTSLVHKLGTRGIIAVPLASRSGIVGCVALMADDARPPLGPAELTLVRDLAIRAGLMLENTTLYARERATISTLQRSMLPRLPNIPWMTVAAAYVPAADEAAVGGDWYDVFALRGHRGAVGVAVGDVMGHNIDSAARMGKLSTVVRAYGFPGTPPREVLSAVDELLAGSSMDMLATCFYATVTPHASGATLQYSSAGHPPAIVRQPDGRAEVLQAGRGPMLGVSRLLATGAARTADATIELAPGATLICYTDGLVDAFTDDSDVDVALARLCEVAAALPVDAAPQQLIDELSQPGQRHKDDVAVVAMRIS